MIVTIAHAKADEAAHTNVFGAWSDLVVGTRPDGLIDSYLLQGEGVIQIIAVWESLGAHARAMEETGHPGYVVFEAAGLDPVHSILNVVGSIHQHD